eukprot:TRINITY_DN965_c0_g1_i1.p1 TRINITY_DN965_c0_g1~~TRINITY_DN965_c0_g1_i1.p1  ORF type:complete len:1273 (-),score=506.95 TRINITY_DN965_c0_g1_i1:247-4065(-)
MTDKGEEKEVEAEKKEEKKDEKKEKPKEPDVVPLFSLFRFSNLTDRLLILVGVIFSLGVGAALPIQILVFGNLVSDIGPALMDPTPGALLRALRPTILAIVYIGIAMFFGGYIQQMMWILSGENQTTRIRKLYVHAILRQDNGWFDVAKDESGSLNTRLANDTQEIQEAISEKAGSTVQLTAQFVTGLIVAFVKGWRLSLVILATIPLLAIVGGVVFTFVTKFQTEGQNAYAEAGAIAEQALGGIRTVFSFSLQKRFQERYEVKLEKAKIENTKSGLIIGLGFGVLIFFLFSSYGLAFWYGAKLVADGTDGMDGGRVLTIFLALIMGAFGIMQMSPHFQAFGKGRAAAFQVFKTIDRVPEIDTDDKGGEKIEDVKGEISLKNIKFHYPSRPDVPIMEDLSLNIESGKTVAFVGPSGSGKSTVISLVQRFYDPVEGQVCLDGRNIKDLNLKWLRRQIGIVSQEPVLFNTTIKKNILLGVADDRKVSDEEVEEACKKANCHNFITQLPKGYDTMVGEHGGMLSGGQKQRIAIARAILKNPKILLLDEATSALDTTSEKLVQKALDAMSKDRTTIVIAHRLSTIKNADLIVVMSKGKAVEMGNHDELYAQGGVYTALVDKQKIKMKQDPLGSKVDVPLDDAELEAELMKEKISVVKKIAKADGTEETIIHIEENQNRLKEDDLSKGNIRRVIRMMRPDWHLLIIGCIAASVTGMIFPFYGFLFSKVVTVLTVPSYISDPDLKKGGAYLYAFLFAVIGLASLFSITIEIYSFSTAGARLAKKIRAKTFSKLMRQEVGFFDKEENSTGALTSALATDAGGVGDVVTKVWGDFVELVSAFTTAIIIAFIYSWKLSLVLLAAVPFVLGTASLEARSWESFEDKTKKAFMKSGEIASEAFKEIRTVKSLTVEKYWEDLYEESIAYPHKLAFRKAFVSSLSYGAHQAINMWTTSLGFYAGVRFVEAGMADFQDVLVVTMVILLTCGSMGRASLFAAKYGKGKKCVANTFKLVDRVSAIDPEEPGDEPSSLEGDIDLKNISFKYPARSDVNIFSGEFGFTAKPRQTVALVGSSGCGKSTTIGLIERWYDPLSGTIEVDGKNVKNYQLKRGLRKHISLVGQEPVLFDMTIEENIRYGSDQEISQEELEECARSANIHDFIVELPDGYKTKVGDKGSQLSGGQKQRIAIARALVRKPKILLLDEATSALDSESEKLVQNAIDRAVEGRTTITIAHRLSTIQNADLICVVKDGKIVESGKHFDLINMNGVYKELVDQQDLNALDG